MRSFFDRDFYRLDPACGESPDCAVPHPPSWNFDRVVHEQNLGHELNGVKDEVQFRGAIYEAGC
jgi:hypothetical protein